METELMLKERQLSIVINWSKCRWMREAHVWFLSVLVVFVAVLGKSEVTDFDDVIVGKQNVACSQVTVYDLHDRHRSYSSTEETKYVEN